jgi:hypothetical protein
MATNRTHTFSPSVSLAAAKTMDMSAVITAIKLIHNQAISLGYQCHLTTVSAPNAYISPHAVLKPRRNQSLSKPNCVHKKLKRLWYPPEAKREILKNR